MNSLNSILLEGTLLQDPINTSDNLTKSCILHIANHRYHKVKGVSVKNTSNFTVKAVLKIAENCMDNLKKDSGVRVVGRLETNVLTIYDESSKEDISVAQVIIKAEHVEFKPMQVPDGD